MRLHKRQILVPLYFFLGGLAGGCFVLAVVSHAALGSAGHPLVLRGFVLAFPVLLVSAAILTIDLTRPGRFWRLFTRVKPISPVSMGSWALLVFGLLAAAAWFKVMIYALGPFLPEWVVRLVLALPLPWIEGPGLPVALFVAGYTGVLLNTSARPVWASQPLFGGLFFASALATSVALLFLWTSAERSLTETTLQRLVRAEQLFLIAQLVLTAGFVGLALRRVGGRNSRLNELLRGRLSPLFHASWGIGALFPVAVLSLVPVRSKLAQAATVAVLLGGLAMRYALFLCEEPGE